MQAHEAAADPAAVREFHRKFATGVTVVTTLDGDRPKGLAVNAFCSVSLDPPTVLVCVQKTSSTHSALARSAHLAVNILAADQADVVGVFASKATDKFSSLAWQPGPHGSPIIEGACATVEVEIDRKLDAVTHTVFLGRVVDARCGAGLPLIYHAGTLFDPSGLAPLPA